MSDDQKESAANAQQAVLAKSERERAPWVRTTHPAAQWFPNAGLGLFLHWGLSSVWAGGDLSWGMIAETTWDQEEQGKNKLTPNEYFRLADRFKPSRYDPDRWLSAAAAAGFKYAVLTTKHHEGYTLWPSRFSDFGTQSHMGGRDLIGPFVEACHRHGLKAGLYYSPPDWWFHRRYMNWRFSEKWADIQSISDPAYDMDHRPCPMPPPRPPEVKAVHAQMVRNHVRELMTRYHPLDLFWFDGAQGEIESEELRDIHPGVLLNARNDGRGDYGHSECTMPKEKHDGWFETCWCSWGHWGYVRNRRQEPAGETLARLMELRSMGGNYLPNAGPDADGELTPGAYECWRDMAVWMKHSAEAVYDVGSGPWPEQCNVPVTVKGKTWYACLRTSDAGPVELRNVARPAEATVLATGKPVAVEFKDGMARFGIPLAERTPLVDVVRVRW
ncbi:MAG: alpha-L-fucosidase [Kiritimatiellia bacterium]